MTSSQPTVPDTPEIENESIEDRLYTVKYSDSGKSHLDVKVEGICEEKCTNYECVNACPADVWRSEGGGVPTIAYENCLECSSCRFACPSDNVEWTYPDTGGGVVFKHG